jgi:hypothetical protein
MSKREAEQVFWLHIVSFHSLHQFIGQQCLTKGLYKMLEYVYIQYIAYNNAYKLSNQAVAVI